MRQALILESRDLLALAKGQPLTIVLGTESIDLLLAKGDTDARHTRVAMGAGKKKGRGRGTYTHFCRCGARYKSQSGRDYHVRTNAVAKDSKGEYQHKAIAKRGIK